MMTMGEGLHYPQPLDPQLSWLERKTPELLPAFGNGTLRQAASWRIASELARLAPERLFVCESENGGFPYDCLVVADPASEHSIFFNRESTGSASVPSPGLGPMDRGIDDGFLLKWLSVADRRRMVRAFAEVLGVNAADEWGPPPPTRRTLTYETLAGFLQARAMDATTWTVAGAMVEGLGGVRLRDEHIAAFPGLHIPRPASGTARALFLSPAADTWFICREGVPVAYVTCDAHAWQRDGSTFDLRRVLARAGHIDAVVARLARFVGA